MRVEAIVKDGGLFIPKPGFPIADRASFLLDIEPVKSPQEDRVLLQAAGILNKRPVDGVKFQKKLRQEWDK